MNELVKLVSQKTDLSEGRDDGTDLQTVLLRELVEDLVLIGGCAEAVVGGLDAAHAVGALVRNRPGHGKERICDLFRSIPQWQHLGQRRLAIRRLRRFPAGIERPDHH